jgi:hypothetical protein
MGYFDVESQQLRPVVVISCEKNQENRIIKHIQGVKRVNEKLHRPALSFCPGYLLYLDQNDPSKDVAFKVQEYIDK